MAAFRLPEGDSGRSLNWEVTAALRPNFGRSTGSLAILKAADCSADADHVGLLALDRFAESDLIW
jgi:hypothetical protein